jgi:hypothetical protein
MKLGAEDKKKVYALAVLGLIMAIAVYSSFFSDSSSSSSSSTSAAITDRNRAAADAVNPTAPMPGKTSTPTRPRSLVNNHSRSDEFHPSIRPKREEDRQDPMTIDPTLHLELLAKVQDVKLDGGQRNLFQFGPAVKLEGTDIKIVPKVAEMYGPHPAPPPAPPPPPPPPPPPTPFTPKYHGLATKQIDGKKTAFFLDGEEIILATEGMTVKRRFKLVRIAANSVVVQDLESKREQTIQISEDAGGNSSQG